MSLILKGIDLPQEVNGTKLALELYVRSDGIVFNDDFEEVGRAIQIPKGHGRIGDLEKLAKLLSDFGESLKESARGNKLLMTERDICHAMAVLTEHFQEYEPLLEAEENEC